MSRHGTRRAFEVVVTLHVCAMAWGQAPPREPCSVKIHSDTVTPVGTDLECDIYDCLMGADCADCLAELQIPPDTQITLDQFFEDLSDLIIDIGPDGQPASDCQFPVDGALCDLVENFHKDCNRNGLDDECEIEECETESIDEWWCWDTNANDTPDSCDLEDGEIWSDANENGLPDWLDVLNCLDANNCADCVADLMSEGVTLNGQGGIQLTGLTLNAASLDDCDNDGIPNVCEIGNPGAGWEDKDVNQNGKPDGCDLV